MQAQPTWLQRYGVGEQTISRTMGWQDVRKNASTSRPNRHGCMAHTQGMPLSLPHATVQDAMDVLSNGLHIYTDKEQCQALVLATQQFNFSTDRHACQGRTAGQQLQQLAPSVPMPYAVLVVCGRCHLLDHRFKCCTVHWGLIRQRVRSTGLCTSAQRHWPSECARRAQSPQGW